MNAQSQYEKFDEIYMRHYNNAYPLNHDKKLIGKMSGRIQSHGYYHGLRMLVHEKTIYTIKGGNQWGKMGKNGGKWGIYFMGNRVNRLRNSPFFPIFSRILFTFIEFS